MIADIAAPLIGRPYRVGASGPDAFDCWGLARALLTASGVAGLPQRLEDVPDAARALGWRPVVGDLADGDVLSMRGAERHVGVIACMPGQAPRCVHATRDGVAVDPVSLLPELGFSDLQAWRRAA